METLAPCILKQLPSEGQLLLTGGGQPVSFSWDSSSIEGALSPTPNAVLC